MQSDTQPDFDNEQRPEIVYPCRWEYKVIGAHREQMEAAIASIVQGLDHTLTFSHSSSGGKYCSFLLSVNVESQEQRDAIFKSLHTHGDIRTVI